MGGNLQNIAVPARNDSAELEGVAKLPIFKSSRIEYFGQNCDFREIIEIFNSHRAKFRKN